MTKRFDCQSRALKGGFWVVRTLAWVGWWALVAASQGQTNFEIVKSFGFPGLSTGASPESAMILGSDGALYGVAPSGGSNMLGVVFRMDTNGSGYRVLYAFGNGANDGAGPGAELLEGSDGALYGTTAGGGASGEGTIFTIQTDGTGYSLLHSFSEGDGVSPKGGLLEGREDGMLYGTTSYGGATNSFGGTVFKMNRDGGGFEVVYNFLAPSGAEPMCGLVEGEDGYLYGTTVTEGADFNGSIFKLARDGSLFQNMRSFLGTLGDGEWAQGRLLQGSDGYLYGTCKTGGNLGLEYGSTGNGTIYKIDTNGNNYELVYSFPTSGANGANPEAGLQFGPGADLYGVTAAGGSSNEGVIFQISTTTGDGTVLHNFTGADGSSPEGALTAGNGIFYGTAAAGGGWGYGTAFQVTTSGAFGTLHDFAPPAGGDGADPAAPVSISGSVVYGTTSAGGAAGGGVVFDLELDGSDYGILHSFTNDNGDGYHPQGALLKALDGFLYGTTREGGSSGDGTVFKVRADGSLYAVLHAFTNSPGDGSEPMAGLIQGADGGLYGTTSEGGSHSDGIVFKINTNGGGYAVLYNFAGEPDGSSPDGALTQDRYGILYGTTQYGGAKGDGTVFSLTTNGERPDHVLHDFGGPPGDGANPEAGLCLGLDGRLYGTTYDGGTNYSGSVFSLATNGESYAVLRSVDGFLEGYYPESQLVQGGNGLLYGTCDGGGAGGDGTVFSLDTNGWDFTVLHAFSAEDCRSLAVGVALAPDGSIWGAAALGGSMNNGAIYKLFPTPGGGGGGSPPSVMTVGASNITASSASLYGTVNANGSLTALFFYWGTTTNYGAMLGPFLVGAGVVPSLQRIDVSGLADATTYHFTVAATNLLGTNTGADMTFTTASGPFATTLAASAVGGNSATLNGTVNPDGQTTAVYMLWGTNANFGQTNKLATLAAGAGSQNVSATLTGLSVKTKYYFTVLASNSVGVSYGTALHFTTTTAPPSVATVPAANVTGSSASLFASVNANGSLTALFFYWGTTTNYGAMLGPFLVGAGVVPSLQRIDVSGLAASTTYHFTVAATNLLGTNTGADMTFTTASGPFATTLAASAVGGKSATLNGTVNPDGQTTAVYMLWGTNANFGQTNKLATLAAGAGSQNVSATLTGLSVKTKYYFTVLASNSVGVSYGTALHFTTTTAPPSVATVPAANVTGSSASLFASVNANGSLTALFFYWGTTTNYGAMLGPFLVGAGVVPSLQRIDVSGLAASTTYHFTVAATNVIGTNRGADMTFTTLSSTGGDTIVRRAEVSPAASPARILAITILVDGSKRIDLAGGTPGQTYVVEAASSLGAVSWIAIGSNSCDSNGQFSLVDSQSSNAPSRYYRLQNNP